MGEGAGAACSCSAPPQGFEASVQTASQSLTAMPPAGPTSDQPLGPGFLAGQSASRDSATSAQTIKFVFPEHLPCDHRDPTLSHGINTAQNWEANPPVPMIQLRGLPRNLVLEPKPSILHEDNLGHAPPPAPRPIPSPPSNTTAPTQGWWREK